MKRAGRLKAFWRRLRNPHPTSYEPTAEQRQPITEAIRKQRFRGDMAGRLEYKDP